MNNQAIYVTESNAAKVSEGSCTDIKWTREKINEILQDVIAQIQAEGGNAVPDFTPELCIMQEVDRFDSLIAVEAVCQLSERFGADLPEGIFYDVASGMPYTLEQIIERIYGSLNQKELKGTQPE